MHRTIWRVRVVVGLLLVFFGAFGFYSHFGAWTLLLSPASLIAGGLIMPLRELLLIRREQKDRREQQAGGRTDNDMKWPTE